MPDRSRNDPVSDLDMANMSGPEYERFDEARGRMLRGQRQRPRDVNQLAASIVDEATSDEPRDPYEGKDPAAVELGRRGGLKGGKARAAKLSAEERSEAARNAARARWSDRS